MARQLKYDQARLAVLNIIATEGLKSGNRLPSERQLITRVDCSLITLRRALGDLEKSGMIERHLGCGTFVKRTVANSERSGKVLFVNVNSRNELTPPRAWIREVMSSYFSQRGIALVYLSVREFSNEITVAAAGAQGILLYGELTKSFLESVSVLKMPTIVIGNITNQSGFAQVKLDVVACTESLTNYFLADHISSIALVNSDPNYYMTNEIETGFRRALKASGRTDLKIFSNCIRSDLQYQMDEVIPKVRDYDAIIMEIGLYHEFLAACRAHNWIVPTRLGVLPLAVDYIDIHNHSLFRPDRNTVFARIPESMFSTASEMLYSNIVNNTPFRSKKLNAVIDDGTREDIPSPHPNDFILEKVYRCEDQQDNH